MATNIPRLAHVGDRTGLEMIRTLQDHGIHQGIDVHMECTVLSCSRMATASPARLSTIESAVAFTSSAPRLCPRHRRLGRAYRITSNSWEYTGDGHALAYRAGAALQDMEFVQFHPTGMVWPPSVRGILVTEGVRGEGGILKNSDGRRFMFDDIPDNYQAQTATDPDEGWRYTQGDKNARRPPELLTRDHVARCIVREVREGRGSPHGGVYLDIAWIKERLPNSAEHIEKKLPSMYHQFKQLADIDITGRANGDRAHDPLCHGWNPSRWRHANVHRARSLRRGRVCGRSARSEPIGGQLVLRPARFRQAGWRPCGDSSLANIRSDEINGGAVDDGPPGKRSLPSPARKRRQSVRDSAHVQSTMQDLVGHRATGRGDATGP